MQGIGVQLAGSGLIIKKTSVRGVESFGMLCSAYDIGWSHDADGVLAAMPDSAQPGDACPPEAPKVHAQAQAQAMSYKAASCQLLACFQCPALLQMEGVILHHMQTTQAPLFLSGTVSPAVVLQQIQLEPVAVKSMACIGILTAVEAQQICSGSCGAGRNQAYKWQGW